MSTLINVTREHIALGQRAHKDRCPIALAMRDAGFSEPHVYCSTYNVREDNMLTTQGASRLPDSALEFRVVFDTYGTVAPFWFEIPEDPTA